METTSNNIIKQQIDDTKCSYQRSLHYYCIFMLVVTTFLIFAGGFTTSIDAGMAFLDWPLSNGSINPENWTVEIDKTAEHSHRLLGMKLGSLCIILVSWVFLTKTTPRVRNLALAALGMVIFQGFLGGLRVLLDKQNIEVENNFIARSFAVCHACGAQIVICIIAALVISTSRRWYSSLPKENSVYGKKVYHLGLIASVILFLQIFIGAIMRHSKAALAIPHFPMSTADGGLLPSAWNWMVAINFAHRVGAVLVTVALILFFYHLWRSKEHRNEIGPIIYVPAFLLIIQIFLGALVIWTLKNEHAATIHTLVGAFLLSSCWAITYHSTKLTSSYKKKIVQQPNKALVSLAS